MATNAVHGGAFARKAEQILREEGLRITRARKTILAILSASQGHPNALDIFKRAIAVDRTVSLSTVYRTLKLLEEKGAIHRHTFDGGVSRFEQADRAHHDHLIDVETGKVIEFHSEAIERLQAEVAARLGYEIVDHKLELYGRRKRGR